MTTELEQHFPPDRFTVSEEHRVTAVRDLLRSRSAASWGQGPVPGTGYHLIARWSPPFRGAPSGVVVCKDALYLEALKSL